MASDFSLARVLELHGELQDAVGARLNGVGGALPTLRVFCVRDALWWWVTEFAVDADVVHEDAYNEAHLVGLFIARALYACADIACEYTLPVNGVVHATWRALVPGPFASLTLRQYAMLLQDVQLQFVGVLYTQRVPADEVLALVCALLARLGFFVSVLEHTDATSRLLDDIELVEESASQLVALTAQSARRFVTILHALCLHLYLHVGHVPLTSDKDADARTAALVQAYHVESSQQDYYRLAMHWDCMPAAKAVYMHDFRGLYNDISQVVYFHKSNYERRRAVTLDAARAAVCPVDALPALLQLHPEIELMTEGPALCCASGATWILLPGACYLRLGGVVYGAGSVISLLTYYLATHPSHASTADAAAETGVIRGS